jgi:hypothetical protein
VHGLLSLPRRSQHQPAKSGSSEGPKEPKDPTHEPDHALRNPVTQKEHKPIKKADKVQRRRSSGTTPSLKLVKGDELGVRRDGRKLTNVPQKLLRTLT